MTLHSLSQYDQMDPEIRAQIQSLSSFRWPRGHFSLLLTDESQGNIHVLYEPSVAPLIHIATCRGNDGAYSAFLVKQDHLAKALLNSSSLASEPKSTRSAAMLSLLEATEQRITDILIKSNSMRENSGKKSAPVTPIPDAKIICTPNTDKIPIDYGEKPKDKGFMSWKKHPRVESAYART